MLKQDIHDMQNDTSNTILKITKIDECDAQNPTKEIPATFASGTAGHVTTQSQF